MNYIDYDPDALNRLTRTFTHNAAGQIRTRSTIGTAYDYQAPIANKAYVPDGLNRYASVASTRWFTNMQLAAHMIGASERQAAGYRKLWTTNTECQLR